jgi:hypothetical protein
MIDYWPEAPALPARDHDRAAAEWSPDSEGGVVGGPAAAPTARTAGHGRDDETNDAAWLAFNREAQRLHGVALNSWFDPSPSPRRAAAAARGWSSSPRLRGWSSSAPQLRHDGHPDLAAATAATDDATPRHQILRPDSEMVVEAVVPSPSLQLSSGEAGVSEHSAWAPTPSAADRELDAAIDGLLEVNIALLGDLGGSHAAAPDDE